MMWTHLLEVILTGVGLFVVPVMIVAALAGALALAHRLFHASRDPHAPVAETPGPAGSYRDLDLKRLG